LEFSSLGESDASVSLRQIFCGVTNASRNEYKRKKEEYK
jgi:hypothetical protein